MFLRIDLFEHRPHIAEGVAGTRMPAFVKTLTPEQIDAVVAYLKALKPEV